MPPYRRWWWRRQQPTRRRYYRRHWNKRRRIRRTLQRRYRPRRRWVRKFRFRKIKRKLKSLKVRQWQPKVIHKCKIRGYKCLFWAGPDRVSNNYAQYQQSYTNPHQPGGGGWSMLVFSLDALWEEHQLDRNWWTAGNKGLPLVRYNGCTFKFFREEYTDYAVTYRLCYPMLDSKYEHANCSPYNTLLAKHRIIIPSKRTKPNGKPYVKKRFRPPAQLYNKWYFQSDMCKTGLLMLTATSISLNNFYLSPSAYSNNISIWTLNPKTFRHNGFIHPDTNGYSPNTNLYLYCIPSPRATEPYKIGDLSYLGKPGNYTLGIPFNQHSNNYDSSPNLWGNPFHPQVLNLDIPVYKSTQQPRTILTTTNSTLNIKDKTELLTPVTEPLIKELRYNPDADTGNNTSIYLYSIERNTTIGFPTPEDANVKIEGFPIHLGLWGWLDWQKKLAYLHNIDSSYVVVIRTPYTEPKEEYIIPIDRNFLEGKGPYGIPHSELNQYSLSSWWPKVAHQMVTVNTICNCGPATSKYEKVKAIQAHCEYKFHFRWGGCPAPMIDLTNPCLQPKYAVPDTMLQRLQVQDPKFKPELELHDFDERHKTITSKCIERIKAHTELEQTVMSITGCTNPPVQTTRQKIQEEIQTPPEEKEEQTLQQQLKQLKQQQRLLRTAILRLMQPNIE